MNTTAERKSTWWTMLHSTKLTILLSRRLLKDTEASTSQQLPSKARALDEPSDRCRYLLLRPINLCHLTHLNGVPCTYDEFTMICANLLKSC